MPELAKTEPLSEQWENELVENFGGGFNFTTAKRALRKEELTNASNVRMDDSGNLESETGYKTFLATVIGAPRRSIQFNKTDGSIEQLLITDTRVYTKTAGEWQYVSNGTSTTLSIGEAGGSTAMDVVSITGFANGDPIGITLDNGLQHRTTVNGTPAGSTINITVALPSAAAIGKAVIRAATLAGTSDYHVRYITVPSNNWIVFTNGVDIVKYYSTSTGVQNLPGIPGGNVVCRDVAFSFQHILLINTTESGTRYPQRVRNCDTADYTDWSAGNAGYKDLIDTSGEIMCGVPLGPYVIMYKTDSIVRYEYVGSPDQLFNQLPVIPDEGVVSTASVIPVNDSRHFVVGENNVFFYEGTFELQKVNQGIYKRLFGKSGQIDPSKAHRTFVTRVTTLEEVWVFYAATSDTTYPSKVAKYKLLHNSWYERSFPVEICGFGFADDNTTLKWNELVGPWTSQTWTWGSAIASAKPPRFLIANADALQVYQYDFTNNDDSGTTIDWFIDTKEFYVPRRRLRVDNIQFKGRGASVEVQYSVDSGISFTNMGVKALTGDSLVYRISKQFVGRSVIWRFKGTGAGFQLEWISFDYIGESDV